MDHPWTIFKAFWVAWLETLVASIKIPRANVLHRGTILETEYYLNGYLEIQFLKSVERMFEHIDKQNIRLSFSKPVFLQEHVIVRRGLGWWIQHFIENDALTQSIMFYAIQMSARLQVVCRMLGYWATVVECMSKSTLEYHQRGWRKCFDACDWRFLSTFQTYELGKDVGLWTFFFLFDAATSCQLFLFAK